jgi:ubiquinone/menaquinone biosynthesis C-methylase UbiE
VRGWIYLGNAAEKYEHYFVPAIAAPLAADLVARAALRPGERVVDIACGTGVVTRLAAQRVGVAETVAGVDVNAGMLAVGRAAAPAGMAIDWYEASAEDLPLPDEAFDVALCQLALQFFADKPAALREMRRVLTPGVSFSTCRAPHLRSSRFSKRRWPAILLPTSPPSCRRSSRFTSRRRSAISSRTPASPPSNSGRPRRRCRSHH